MIKFFRKIRQQLLIENQMKKYSLYAIGEIVLVVLGILIALQINNWNENRNNQLQTISYLKAIKLNLHTDLEQISQNEKYLDDYEKMGFNLWNFLYGDGKDVDSSRLNADYLQVCLQREFSPTYTAYDNIVSSGNINLIKNNQLKELLASFYTENLFIDNSKAQRNKVENLYYDIRYDFIHPLMHRDYLSKRILGNKNIDLSKYQIDWAGVRNSSEYKKILGRILALRIPSRSRIIINRNNVKNLIAAIDEELKKSNSND